VTSSWPAPFDLSGRVAAVTGAGSGMGRAIAQTLAAAGAAVVVGDIADDTAGETVRLVTDAGGRAVAQHVDVASRASLEALMARAVDEFGGLHIACNHGGPPIPLVELVDVTDEAWDRALSTHLRGVLHGCQAAVPHIEASGGGAIVNMSSSTIDLPTAGNGLYSLVKTGVAHLTKILALELGPRGIRVNAIAPGVTITGFSRRWFSDEHGNIDEARREAWIAEGAARSPLGRVSYPEDQAWLVLYLVSEASRTVTGQVLRANAGWTLP
jgi:3-oxoacyl-[acyl-carrier protein] reductase